MSKEVELQKRSSLLFWFPKIKNLGIPVPKTEVLEIERWDFLRWLWGERSIDKYIPRIVEKARKIGYPLFLRTDQASGKHSWKEACYIKSEKDLLKNLARVIEFNETATIIGLPYKALVFREYIDLDWKFKAFWGEMPVAKERRYFIKNGRVLCHHPYWIEDAILRPSVENWRDLLKELNHETDEEIKLLSGYAERVAKVLDGYWSVDFACARDGKWFLIDMAVGEISWHPDCPIKKEEDEK